VLEWERHTLDQLLGFSGSLLSKVTIALVVCCDSNDVFFSTINDPGSGSDIAFETSMTISTVTGRKNAAFLIGDYKCNYCQCR
jgi:hypothetical protein